MSIDREFTHPHFGDQARVEVYGREVRLIFVAHTPEQANDFADSVVEQLKDGDLRIRMVGKVTSVEED
jgi:hypothetical protein